MDPGLLQKDLVRMWGATEQSVRFWEADKTRPIRKYMPEVIKFLGYDPFPEPKMLSEKLKHYRLLNGLTQKTLAGILGVARDTLVDWENGNHKPVGRSVDTLRRLGLG